MISRSDAETQRKKDKGRRLKDEKGRVEEVHWEFY
jgi:hypothetical protein